MSAGEYSPPYTITTPILRRVAEISEQVGRLTHIEEQRAVPRLRRENRIRTIQASLAIENNTLSVEQVTAVIDGKHVLGDPREIQEVRNAFAAYEAMDAWNPASMRDLLSAHGLLMSGLVSGAGRLRSGAVGVFRGDEVVHMAPPAGIVPGHMERLLAWLGRTGEHPLVSGCVFHYELEFIHPFADGNGRMGRLWQTLVLRSWKPILGYLPVESVIKQRQQDYYRVLSETDKEGDSSRFIEFILTALRDAINEAAETSK